MHYSTTQEKEYGKVNQTFVAPHNPVKISDADVAFPAHVVGNLLPKWEDIPEDFRRQRGEWVHLVNVWFAQGLNKKDIPALKQGFDANEAWRHLKACMGSYQPAHEHKVAGVAYLMSLWFEPIKEDAAS